MARGSNEVKPLFGDGEEPKLKQMTTSTNEAAKTDNEEQQSKKYTSDKHKEKKVTVPTTLSKYQKQPKYKTHVPHNIRIPKEMREDLEKIAKKLRIPLGKNTGFFQEFTIDALRPAIEKAKKELGIED